MLKLLFFLFLLLLFITIYSFKKRINNILDTLFPKRGKRDTNQPEELVRCANCGVYIPKADAVKKIKFNGEIIYFCSKKCKNEYKR